MALDISSPLPTVGGDFGTWGTKLNTAITEIINEAGKDSDIVNLQSTKADKGIAYSNTENNVRIVQGVPQGGKMHLGKLGTGAIKIKLPRAKSDTMFKFRIMINGYSTDSRQSNAVYIVKGYNYQSGFGSSANNTATCQVTTIKDNPTTMSPTFYFCTGETEDYILIGEITDIHNYKSVVIDSVETHHTGITDDWASGWAISLVTTLETLDSTRKVTVVPTLNATHLNGVQETTTATANTIVKRDENGAVVNSQYKLSALNTVPASPAATGTTGEVRVTSNGIYYCIATNTWGKALPVVFASETLSGLSTTFTASTLGIINANNKYFWMISSGAHNATIESTHNLYLGNSIYSLVTGATVTQVTANSVFSVRIGDSVLEIKFDIGTGAVSYRIASGTITSITVNRMTINVGW